MTIKIVSAALKVQGLILSLPPPKRHPDLVKLLNTNLNRKIFVIPSEQGFLTSTGEFVGREQAYIIAKEQGQINDSCRGPELFSEDLW